MPGKARGGRGRGGGGGNRRGGRGGGGGRGGRQSKGVQMALPEDGRLGDEVDSFAEQSDHITISNSHTSADADGADDERPDPHAIGLAVHAEDADADDDADDDATAAFYGGASGGDGDGDGDGDGGGSGDDETKDISKAWGKKRNLFYGTETGGGAEIETTTEEDKKLEDEEAAEAMRQQQIKAGEAAEEDFDGSMLGAIVAKQQSEQQQKAAAAAAAADAVAAIPKKKKKSKAQELTELALMDTEEQPLPTAPAPTAAAPVPAAAVEDAKTIAAKPTANGKSKKSKQSATGRAATATAAATSSGDELAATLSLEESTLLDGGIESDVGVERVERDLSSLSSADKLAILKRDAPELLPLLDDFKSSLHELKSYVLPTLKRVENMPIAGDACFELLELKRQLLVQYCTNAAFYLLLKSERKPVRNHPVVKELVTIKSGLGQIEDKPLKSHIAKLLKASQAGSRSIPKKPKAVPAAVAAVEDGDGDDDDDDAEDADEDAALKLMAQAEAAGDEDDDGGDDEDGDVDEAALAAALAAEDDAEADADAENDTAAAPVASNGDAYFLNLNRTAKAAAAKRGSNKRKAELAAPDDLDAEHERLLARSAADDDELARMEAKLNRKSATGGKPKAKSENGGGGGGLQIGADSDDELDLDDQEYKLAAEAGKQKKKKRKDSHPVPEKRLDPIDPDQEIGADKRRPIGQKIDKNRGLMPSRRKDMKTPRTANREKYRVREKQRGSQVQKFKGSVSQGYGGEGTGIKKGSVRSTPLG